MPARNVLVAQSGGPTCVINNSLRGIVEGCRRAPGFGTVYAGNFGIEGVLKEELIDLSAVPAEEVSLLRTTPAAGVIGTCRYKLKSGQDDDFQRVVDVLKAHEIGAFFYLGGNDSQDTAHKVSLLANGGLDLVAVGVPKTIDNDLGDSEFQLLDHSPGYGSVARYYAQYVRQANEENAGSSPADPVLVIQAMGRKIGFIPAAARLADPERRMPLQIYLAESPCTLKQLGDNVLGQLQSHGRCIVVVSEGFPIDSDLGAARDSFGHVQFSASATTVAQQVVNYLNTLKFPVPGRARGQVPGTDQRHAIAYASVVDLDEAYAVGRHAVTIAREVGNGYMATILRDRAESAYSVSYDKVPLEKVANSERAFPKSWIAPSGTDVTDDFVNYAMPLIGEDWVSVPSVGGLARFARIEKTFAKKRLPEYVPQTYRAKD